MNTTDGGRVLLIDDDPDMRFLVRCLLENICDIEEEENADKGLRRAMANPPDLVLMDVNMPGQDGFMACRQMRMAPETAEVPIIFITSSTSRDQIVEGFSAGAIDYITKPFDQSELCARVGAHLRLCRANKERFARIGYLSRALQGLEQSYLFFADHTADVILRCGPDRVVRHVNRRWATLPGLKLENPISFRIEDLAAEDERGIVASSIEEALEQQREDLRLQFSLANDQGGLPVQASFLFCRDLSSTCSEINVIISDVSELVTSVLESKHAGRELAKAHTSYLENVSHDIRTPLNGIVGAAAALQEIELDGEAGQMVSIVAAEAARLEGLLDAMLALRAEGAASVLNPADRKVLVVDDSYANLKVLSFLLKRIGFQSIDLAASGEEGWKMWEEGRHDLAFFDYRMDEMSGHDLCRLIRAHPAGASTVILGVSAHALPENAAEATAAGFNAQVAKPISRIKLEGALHSLGVATAPA